MKNIAARKTLSIHGYADGLMYEKKTATSDGIVETETEFVSLRTENGDYDVLYLVTKSSEG